MSGFARKFLKCLAWLVASLPPWARVLLSFVLAWLWFDVFRIRRAVALDNLKIAFPQWSEKERVRCGRASVRSLAYQLVNHALMPFFDRQMADQLFVLDGLENWQAALAENKGVLLMSMHLGQGDLAVAALSRWGLPLHLISKEFKNEWLNRLWFGMRARHGTHFISYHKSIFDILKALKKNAGVIFVIDQFMGPPSGVPVTFFSHATGTAKGLAMIAERTHAPVIPVYTFDLPNQKSRIVFDKPILFEPQATNEATIAKMTQVYTDYIETIVRKYPAQWMWIHKRWKNFA